MINGIIKSVFFNGTGIDVNLATKTNCDDHKWLPSLLYAGRLAFMPKGGDANVSRLAGESERR